MTILEKADVKIGRIVANQRDDRIDRRVCGQSLVEYVPSIYRDDAKGIGGTGSDSTHYAMLERVFSHVTLTASDTLIDIGCGKGRVLAFLIRQDCPARLYGIEYNEEVGRLAREWTKRYEQADILIGDALRLDYDPYTVLTLARSFLPKTFLVFAERVEETVTHPVTLVSWYDSQSDRLLKRRPGWTRLHNGVISRVNGVRLYRVPQNYSVWTYDPHTK